jgi:hypothetical protein
VLLNKDEVPNMDIPKITLNFMFDRLALVLEQNQYQDAMDMIEDFALYSRSAPVRRLPLSSPCSQWPLPW